jgi:hypothetical protein
MQVNKKLLFFLFLLPLFLHAYGPNQESLKSYFFPSDFECLPISDWKNPCAEDFRIIQRTLNYKIIALKDAPLESRPFLNNLLNTDFYNW